MDLSKLILLLLLVGFSASTNSDDALPSYLRGLNWAKVQEYSNEDLSLPDSVAPEHYAIDLSVNVRGHAGAKRSEFNGTVSIYLKFRKPVDKVELHSNGLIIEKAEFLESLIISSSVAVTKISTYTERETITIHANRTIKADEEFMLQITYRGLAKMDEYGLYESWDPKLNKSLDSNGPFVLASRNFPTGARYWFPCFDEPQRNATFELHVTHPSGLNAYSNSDVKRTENAGKERTLTVFEKTHSMPTYLLALSVNHLASKIIDVEGLGNIRVIRSNNSAEIRTPYFENEESFEIYRRKIKKGIYNDISLLLKWKLETMDEWILAMFPKEKLDIIILEGSYAYSFQPGLVTIGANSLWEADFYTNFDQLITRNLIFTKNTNHIWLNDMLSKEMMVKTAERAIAFSDDLPDHNSFSSLHETPLRDTKLDSTSTRQYLASKNSIRQIKASHIMRIISRFCPSSNETIKEYVMSNLGGYADIETFIDVVSKSCSDPMVAKEFLEDYINQPGKALLTVKRVRKTITITQSRYLSTYFDSKHRDNITRYTIPIYYTVNGQTRVKVFRKNETSATIEASESSNFLIDNSVEQLYLVYYENFSAPDRVLAETERNSLMLALRKSMITALNIGLITFDQLYDRLKYYVEAKIFTEDLSIINFKWLDISSVRRNYSIYKDNFDLCEWYIDEGTSNWTSWNGLFNNDATYWERHHVFVTIRCMREWSNATAYQEFLERNFLGENTVIRPEHMDRIGEYSRLTKDQWPDLHRFFFKNAANITDHRFNLLAETVLTQLIVAHKPYPSDFIVDDFRNALRSFVIRNPRRAASLSTQIAMRLEREFIKDERPKLENDNHMKNNNHMYDKFEELEKRRLELRNGTF